MFIASSHHLQQSKNENVCNYANNLIKDFIVLVVIFVDLFYKLSNDEVLLASVLFSVSLKLDKRICRLNFCEELETGFVLGESESTCIKHTSICIFYFSLHLIVCLAHRVKNSQFFSWFELKSLRQKEIKHEVLFDNFDGVKFNWVGLFARWWTEKFRK